MEMDDYQTDVVRTAAPNQTVMEGLNEASLGLIGEVGELVDHYKKLRHHGHQLDSHYVKEEAGDALFYLTRFIERAGLTLNEVARYNIEKRRLRYPDGWSEQRSINRKDQ